MLKAGKALALPESKPCWIRLGGMAVAHCWVFLMLLQKVENNKNVKFKTTQLHVNGGKIWENLFICIAKMAF